MEPVIITGKGECHYGQEAADDQFGNEGKIALEAILKLLTERTGSEVPCPPESDLEGEEAGDGQQDVTFLFVTCIIIYVRIFFHIMAEVFHGRLPNTELRQKAFFGFFRSLSKLESGLKARGHCSNGETCRAVKKVVPPLFQRDFICQINFDFRIGRIFANPNRERKDHHNAAMFRSGMRVDNN